MEDMMKWLLGQPEVSHVEVRAANQYIKNGSVGYWRIIVHKFDKSWSEIEGVGYSMLEAQTDLAGKL